MTFPEMIHGAKPEVAPFEKTDPIEELMKLLSGEIKDWPQIQKLGDLFQSDVFQKLSNAGLDLKSIISGGGENVQQTLTNALSLQKGELPEAAKKEIFRSSAFQNLGSGLMGSAMGGANSLRNLGIGTLDAMQKGAGLASEAGNASQRWMQMAQGTMLPASSQLYSPEWFSQFMAQQRQAKQATQQMRNNVAAAPDPVISGIAGTVMNLVGAYLGAGRGGGGNMLATSDPNKTAPAYVGGNVSTPSGANYGQGPAGYQVGTSGYNNEIGAPADTGFYQSPFVNTNIAGNTPAGYNFSAVPPGSYPSNSSFLFAGNSPDPFNQQGY